MKKPAKRSAKIKKTTAEFRPYRVLFLVVVLSVTCIVLLAALGVASET